MSIGIKAIKSYVPEGRRNLSTLRDRFGLDREFLEDKLGIVSLPIASEKEASSDLAVSAVARLEDVGLEKDQVGLLLVCTQNPDYKLPNTAAIVQDKLGLPTSLVAFDLNQGCSGFIYSLAVAKSMIQTLGLKDAVIVTVDLYSKIIDENDKNTVLLFGDAAVAIWLAYDTEGEILKFSFGTDGGGFDKLMVKYGGSRFPLKDSKKISPENQDQYVRMDGRAIFTFMMKRIPVDINNCLIKNQLSMKDIDFFIFHQASRYMLNNLGAKLKIPEEKLVCSLDIAGNTVSSSIPLACERLLNNKNLKNKTLLFSGFGVGLSWGSVVVRF